MHPCMTTDQLPIMVKSPQMVQTRRDMLTLPVEASTPVGDTKIPLPMIQPAASLKLVHHLVN